MATIIDLESRRAARRRQEIDTAEDEFFGALELDLAEAVTREDLARLKAELKAEIRAVEARMDALEARVTAQTEQLNRRLQRFERLVTVRLGVFAAAGVGTAALAALLALIF